MARNAGLYLALRFASWLVPVLPPRFAYRLAELAGTCSYYLFAGPRHGISANLSVVLGKPAMSAAVRRAARAAFQNDAKNWIDTLRIGRLSEQDILHAVDIEGWHYLEAAQCQGSGVILVVMHLGNIDLVGQALVARGKRVTIPVEHMKPERLFTFLLQERRSKGINAVPIDRSSWAMARALKAGEIVAIAGDRNVAGRGVRVRFFGEETTLPRGPVALARHSRAPVLIGVGIRLPSNRFHGIVTPSLEMVHSGDAECDERENAARIAGHMEQLIRRYPEQWLVFTPLWTRARPTIRLLP